IALGLISKGLHKVRSCWLLGLPTGLTPVGALCASEALGPSATISLLDGDAVFFH
ncbi:unnamed protein product, partial [Amoebophrya sp. A120]